MTWSESEVVQLAPIVDRIVEDVRGRRDVLVVCAGRGELAFLLAERLPEAQVVGNELNAEALAEAARRCRERGLTERVRFEPAAFDRIPLPDRSFDAVVSDFVVYPTSAPTQFGQPELVRVLRPGGVTVVTDVVGAEQVAGIDYVCEATPDDFRGWMAAAGFERVEVDDVTRVVSPVWLARGGVPAVSYLYVRGERPTA